MTQPPRGLPRLRIFLDTNILFTESAATPVRRDLLALISATSKDPLATVWHIPEVVFHERVAQMLRRALALRPGANELEEVLGVDLNLSARLSRDVFVARVEAALSELGVIRVALDAHAVDWSAVMLAAVYREPPFSPGKSEKGFRDALVLWTLRQAAARAASNDRLVLATGDDLLAVAVSEALPEARVLRSLEELKQALEEHEITFSAVKREHRNAFLAALNIAAARSLDEAGSALDRMTEAVDAFGDEFVAIASSASASAEAPGHAIAPPACSPVAAATETSCALAERLRMDTPIMSAHFAAALLTISEAAATPPVFAEDDEEDLRRALASLDTMLAGLSRTSQAAHRLIDAVRRAAAREPLHGFDPSSLVAAVADLIAELSRILDIGAPALSALRALVAIPDPVPDV